MRDWRGRVPAIEEYGKLPRHQTDMYYRATDIADRKLSEKTSIVQVTPGGGKSLDAVIFAAVMLLSGRVDRIVVAVPRDSLREQMRDAFARHGLDMATVSSGVSQKLLRSTAGYITTYQALGKSTTSHVAALVGFRYAVIVDEFHHLSDADPDGAGWKPGVRAITDGAEHVLCLSGGLARDDGDQVMFVTYDTNRKPIKHITYSRSDALNEEAIIELRVDLLNGDTEYTHNGADHEVELSTAESKKKSRLSVRTALSLDEYRYDLLGKCFDAWLEYRLGGHGYRSQMIVICDSQAGAKNAAKWLKEKDGRFDIGIAISDEGAEAHRAIRRFRNHSGTDILVTCLMAYEGLDAPAATHIAYMTRIRSIPWMDQAFARATRFNPGCRIEWKDQQAYVFAPADPVMQKYVKELQAEQDDRYRERELLKRGGTPFARRSDFSAKSADPTDVLVGGERGLLSPEMQRAIQDLRVDFPGTQAWSVKELERLAIRMMVTKEPL